MAGAAFGLWPAFNTRSKAPSVPNGVVSELKGVPSSRLSDILKQRHKVMSV